MFWAPRITAALACVVTALDCLRRAGIVIESSSPFPLWMQFVFAAAWLGAAIIMLVKGTDF